MNLKLKEDLVQVNSPIKIFKMQFRLNFKKIKILKTKKQKEFSVIEE